MEKEKLDRTQSAFLHDYWRMVLRQQERRKGQIRTNLHIYQGENEALIELVDKFDKVFELPEGSITKSFKKFKDDLTLISNTPPKTKKEDTWFKSDIPVDTAFAIIELHIKDMMDTGYYQNFTDKEQREYLSIFGGTFGHERGEMLKELLEVIKKELSKLK